MQGRVCKGHLLQRGVASCQNGAWRTDRQCMSSIRLLLSANRPWAAAGRLSMSWFHSDSQAHIHHVKVSLWYLCWATAERSLKGSRVSVRFLQPLRGSSPKVCSTDRWLAKWLEKAKENPGGGSWTCNLNIHWADVKLCCSLLFSLDAGWTESPFLAHGGRHTRTVCSSYWSPEDACGFCCNVCTKRQKTACSGKIMWKTICWGGGKLKCSST